MENVGNLKKPEIGENARVGTTDQTDLFRARLVTSVEVEDGRRFAESLIKEMTGGERIRARHMKENFWEFEPTHKAMIVANHRPEIRGTDTGIWRRIKLVPFNVVIPEGERNLHLPEELEAEYEGILAWMVQGALQWRHLGLNEPAPVKAATQEYRDDMDVLANFILSKCVEGPGISVLSTPLYNEYKRWAEDSGEFVLSQTKFSTRLQERGYVKKPTMRGKLWYGIGLRHDDPNPSGPGGGGPNPSFSDSGDSTRHMAQIGIYKPNSTTENFENDGLEGNLPLNTVNNPRVGDLIGKTRHNPSYGSNPSYLENLEDDEVVAVDLETTGLNPWNGDLPTLLAVYGRGMAEPILFRGGEIEKALKQLEGRDVVIHNAMFDLPMLERYYPGTIKQLGKVYDTLTLSKMAYAGQTFEKHGLAECLRRELEIEISKEQQRSDWSGPLSEEQIEYAKKDVLHLPDLLEKLLEKLEDQSKVVDLEVDLTPVLADMKAAGVKVNTEGWREQAERVQGEVEWVEAQLSDRLRDLYIERDVPEDEADETVDELNWGSLKQVQACLSDVDIWIHSIAGDKLKGLDDPTGILGLIQERQKLVKLRNSYGEKFLEKHIADDGLVHADWVQTVSTGRMSCTEPNLQNIPRDAENGEKFRRLIVPKDGKKFVVADYNAIEMRLAAINVIPIDEEGAEEMRRKFFDTYKGFARRKESPGALPTTRARATTDTTRRAPRSGGGGTSPIGLARS